MLLELLCRTQHKAEVTFWLPTKLTVGGNVLSPIRLIMKMSLGNVLHNKAHSVDYNRQPWWWFAEQAGVERRKLLSLAWMWKQYSFDKVALVEKTQRFITHCKKTAVSCMYLRFQIQGSFCHQRISSGIPRHAAECLTATRSYSPDFVCTSCALESILWKSLCTL